VAKSKRIARGLRFNLTAAYTILFTLLLVGVSLLFRQTLATTLRAQSQADLEQRWAILKGYLRIESDPEQAKDFHPIWLFDPDDPEENIIGAQVRSVFSIAFPSGEVMDHSASYQALGFDSAADIARVLNSNQPVWTVKKNSLGVPYQIRAGWLLDEKWRRKFFVAMGASLEDKEQLLSRFTWLVVGIVPLMILAGYGIGWVLAGRALTPVLEIARTARRISGSNLSLRIPPPRVNDELGILIGTFNQMIERLEVNFNQVRQFSTDVSHELRTPITVVRGQLEVALFTAHTAEQYREAIVTSLADIERLSQIVRALLLLSQAETGQVILQKQRLDLVEVTEGIVDQFQIPAEGAEVELTFVANSNHLEGDFDRVQLERMLSNLLSNAVKFTPAGGRVRVVVERHGTSDENLEAEIRVEDTGPGIPAEHLPHIFDRFYRVRGPSEQASPEKGLGLGLSFVAWIARAHEGKVDVESTPGKGTTFRVRLPLTEMKSPAPTPDLQTA
jgi:heavy metal sensor kinase